MADHGCYRTRTERDGGLEAIVLSWQGGAAPPGGTEAWIVPRYGSNLCRLSYGGRRIIDFEKPLLLARDYTGTPVLYPTPNRVRGGVFRWRGRSYPQAKRGRPVLEHGLVHDEPWSFAPPASDATGATLETWIDFREGETLGEAFPFPHRLRLAFRLTARSLTVTYTIHNQGPEALPYGFGLHPYFIKLGGDEGTRVGLPAESVMDATGDLLPTGRRIAVEGTIYDLRQPKALAALDLDHVFTDIPAGGAARVQYPALGLEVGLEATEDFSHLVVYTPRGAGFFCVENQTCSTDAHNLFDRGFARESGLKTVPPWGSRQGSVRYAIRDIGG
jgi:aldose 1-epimerase